MASPSNLPLLSLGVLLLTTLATADVFSEDYPEYNDADYGKQHNQNFISNSNVVAPLMQVKIWNEDKVSPTGGSHIFIRHDFCHSSPLILDATDLSVVYSDRSHQRTSDIRAQKIGNETFVMLYAGYVDGHGVGDEIVLDSRYNEALKVNVHDLSVKNDLHEFQFTDNGTALVTAYPQTPSQDFRTFPPLPTGAVASQNSLPSILGTVSSSQQRTIMANKMLPNQKGFSRRLDAVHDIVHQFGLEASQVTPIAYVEHCPFMFNNYIFKVDLASPATPSTFPNDQPCTSPPPPEGVTTMVVRMRNPQAEGLNNANRVENDVAASHLIRQAVARADLAQVVPAVFAWAPCRFPEVADEKGFGWTLTEFKAGRDLDGEFPALGLDDARAVLEQLADIFAAVQRAEIPAAVTGFGALTINKDGEIVSGQMPLLQGGPWASYADVWAAKLTVKLKESEESPLLDGWKEVGTPERIEKFIATGGVQRILGPVDTKQMILNHGDLTLNNILYDKESNRITALLDFDWAAITHPCDEFLFGLWDVGGGIHERVGKMQPNVLAGDFSHKPDDLSEAEARKWEIAKAWDAALAQRGTIRPSSIAGVDRIQALRDFEEFLCPFSLASEVMLGRISDAEKVVKKEEIRVKIVNWLGEWTD